MKAIVIGGYLDMLGAVLNVYFDSPCEIDGVDEKLFRADPPVMEGSLERYFRGRHLSFLPPEVEDIDQHDLELTC